MITEQDIQAILPQYPSHAALAGIAPRTWAIERLSQLPAPPPPAQPVAVDQPREWEQRLALIEDQMEAQRNHAQRGSAHRAAQRARIEAQARPLAEQRDALNKELAKLDEEYQRWL